MLEMFDRNMLKIPAVAIKSRKQVCFPLIEIERKREGETFQYLMNVPLEEAVSSSKIKKTFPAYCRGRFIDNILLRVDWSSPRAWLGIIDW